jgi:RNA polymerase sigma-70 factor (ECF subfamily)
MIVSAGHGETEEKRRALADLCQTYWYPLYAFARRSGAPAQDAGDLVQGFLAKLIAAESVVSVTPVAGRFRAYLLAGLKHHMADERDRQRAKKRGGGVADLSLSMADGEARYGLESDADPERLFQRKWARTILGQVETMLREEYAGRDRQDLFEALRPLLVGSGPPQAELAGKLGMNTGAIKVALHRMRKRYGELLRGEVAETVADPALVEAEIRELLASLRG